MKKPIILWIVAALFLFCSVPFFGQGSIIEGVCGIAIAAALGVFGYVTMKRTRAAELAKKDTENEEAPVALNDEIAPSECSGNLEAQQDSSYEFLRTKIAGVTFKDGRKSRQTIIRRLYWKDEPFDKNEAEVVLERGEYEGKPAFAVILNGQKAGYVPAEHVQFIEENFARCDGVTHIEAYCGANDIYGAEIIIRFRKP
jgi:hypothetical protein|nr:MAG TPA: hypothetical protein [Caudoviricetes sp.]